MGPKPAWIPGAIRRIFACAIMLLAATTWLPGAAHAQASVAINGTMILVEDLGITKAQDMVAALPGLLSQTCAAGCDRALD